MKTKNSPLPKWITDVLNWIGDDVVCKNFDARHATIEWPNGEQAHIRFYNNCADWEFVGGGFDPEYAAGYAYACGYHD